MRQNNKKSFLPALFIGGCLLFIVLSVYFYQIFYSPNILLEREEGEFLIPKGATLNKVKDLMERQGYIEDVIAFMFVARALNYEKAVKPGRYILKKRMSNLDAIRYLRSGAQSPVKVTFNNARTIKELAPKITATLMLTEAEFLEAANDQALQKELGFNAETLPALFIPNTYEMYWDIEAQALLKRMKYEYDQFWNEKRKAKAQALNMTPLEVASLASIVQAETQKADERPTVAGLYLNRLEKGMFLQADPTLVFAAGDFTIRRVLDRHKEIDSPYNTYKNKGLPPGPINVPDISAIDAVLNHEKHNYLYMCAKEDFSGYHNFARTLSQHNANAVKWQRALNKAKVYK